MRTLRIVLIAVLVVNGGLLCNICMGRSTAQEGFEAPVELRSVKLSELHAEFLANGDERGFWQAVKAMSDEGGYPVVEEVKDPNLSPPDYVSVTFLHRIDSSIPENVLLFANINHVVPAELLFDRLGETDVFFKTVEVPRGVRFEYRIIENDPLTGLFAGAKYGTRRHLLGANPDPLNPNKLVISDGLGVGRDYIKTWVELPGASPQPYIIEKGNPSGTLVTEERLSSMLGYSHKIITFLPPDYDPKKSYPLMILFDAESYFSRGHLKVTLENLIAEGSVPPLLVLGINAGIKDGQTQRNNEFTCNPRFMEFLNDELLPWFTTKYSVSQQPDQRIIAGASFGGLFAAYFAFNHPETVTHVLSQSGSFHWGTGSFNWGKKEGEPAFERLIREFAFAEKKPITIFMEVGILEGEYSWDGPEFPNQLVSHHHFKLILDLKGYDVTFQEYRGGHEMLSWRGGIAEGLTHICGSMALKN